MTAAISLTMNQFVARNMNPMTTDLYAESCRLAESVPRADKNEYLAQAMMGTLSDIIGRRRRDAFDDALEPGAGGDASKPSNAIAETQPPAPQNFSRNDSHREFWMRLRDSMGLAATGGMIRIGDMTAEDLKANIVHREKLAADNLHRAEQFRRLLGMLESAGVDTVDQIP